MNMQKIFNISILAIFISIFSLSLCAAATTDYSSLNVGDLEEVAIKSLHPTQFRVGQAEVDDKADAFEKMGAKDLEKYLKTHPCPVVIGPDGRPYITDEQHRANASFQAETAHHSAVRALENKKGDPTMYMKVIANYSKLSPEEFEKTMIANHYLYLEDQGISKPFKDLPKHITQMKDDPYRSLAGFVERKAYQMSDVFFVQFSVATWLRDQLKMSDKEVSKELKNNRKKFLKKVSDLLESPKAASESWYIHAKSTPTENAGVNCRTKFLKEIFP